MTDKVQKIRKEVERLHGNPYYMMAVKDVLEILDMQEEPVSEDLEDASRNYADDEEYGDDIYFAIKAAFYASAKWQKEQMAAKAIDAHCFGFQGAALFSFRLPAGNYLVGSKVKVIVIKED